ncbi:DUF6493 family protein [Streptosporangium roseum]
MGRALREERSSPLSATSWLGALAVLGSEGRVSRQMLLDGCVSRFLRGGDAQDLRFFARLHELLEPAYAEVEARARDYLRLLPTAPGPVAELSLAHLRRLDRLDPADVTEALEGLLFRAEAGLVRAGLAWLDQVVRQAPERADELVPALASALGHQAYAVQERAVRVAVKHARHLGPLGAETLREALAALPPDLGGRLAAAVGGEAAPQEEPEDFTPPELAAPEPPGPFPGLPASVAGFAGERWAYTWQSGERWPAGFVRFAATDREALRVALSGMARRAAGLYGREEWYAPQDWFTAMAGELVDPGADPGPAGPRRPGHQARPDRLPGERDISRPHRFLLRRYAEVLAALKADALPPLLLATPTAATGHLDPAEFVSRLEAVEAAGAEPLPADFQQALLRLPGTVPPEVVARAGRLTSEAGRRAARRLEDGPVAPETGVSWRYTENMDDYSFEEREPCAAFHTRIIPRLRVEPTGLTHIDELLGGVPAGTWGEHGGHLDWWPAVLPSHRDAIAAHYLPHLPHHWSRPEVRPAHVEMLAAGEGPAGEPTALLLASFLARRDPSEGVRLLLRMAAAGDLPADALGRQLALLTARTDAKLPHATAGLEAAARQGAYREVWAVIRAALPHLLPRAGQRPGAGVNDLVILGATVARWAGARGEIPELVPFADRRSSSAFTRGCRRLHGLLTSPETGA